MICRILPDLHDDLLCFLQSATTKLVYPEPLTYAPMGGKILEFRKRCSVNKGKISLTNKNPSSTTICSDAFPTKAYELMMIETFVLF